MSVRIEPLPAWARTTKFKPLPPSVFADEDPSQDDIELALALFAELDAESRAWYGEPLIERIRSRL